MKLIQRLVHSFVGVLSYPFLVWVNKLRFSGAEHVRGLPAQNVLFVCNHQTYFADVIALLHIFGAIRHGRTDRLGLPFHLLTPSVTIHYVAAGTTMSSTWISRFLTLAGAITVKRTWNAEARESLKGLDASDIRNITRPLAANWVITFPQGTTTPFAPGRKGTALIIKQARPIVIPVVFRGFSAAFDKRKLQLRQPGTNLSVTFKPPLQIDYEAPTEKILAQIMDAIEQTRPQNDIALQR